MICNIFKNTQFVLVVKRCLALSAVVILTVIYNQVNAQGSNAPETGGLSQIGNLSQALFLIFRDKIV